MLPNSYFINKEYSEKNISLNEQNLKIMETFECGNHQDYSPKIKQPTLHTPTKIVKSVNKNGKTNRKCCIVSSKK